MNHLTVLQVASTRATVVENMRHAHRRRILTMPLPRHFRRFIQMNMNSALIGMVVMAACLACSKPAQGLLFSYTEIANNTPASIDRFSSAPAINGFGDVAFYADGSAPLSIYVGDGGLSATPIASSGGAFGLLSEQSELSISDAGDVVFSTETGTGGTGIVRYDAVGSFTEIAEVHSNDDLVNAVTHPSINNFGAAAFVGFERTSPSVSESHFIMLGAGGPTSFSAVASGLGFDFVLPPSMRRSGPALEVAFAARSSSESAVYKVSGLNLTTIIDTRNSDFDRVAS